MWAKGALRISLIKTNSIWCFRFWLFSRCQCLWLLSCTLLVVEHYLWKDHFALSFLLAPWYSILNCIQLLCDVNHIFCFLLRYKLIESHLRLWRLILLLLISWFNFLKVFASSLKYLNRVELLLIVLLFLVLIFKPIITLYLYKALRKHCRLWAWLIKALLSLNITSLFLLRGLIIRGSRQWIMTIIWLTISWNIVDWLS